MTWGFAASFRCFKVASEESINFVSGGFWLLLFDACFEVLCVIFTYVGSSFY